MDLVLLAARLLLAAVFATAGAAKLLDLPGSRRAVADFGVPARAVRSTGVALPVAELVVAVALVPTATARLGALGALALLLVFIAAIGFNLVRGRSPNCHCFGQLHSAPAGWPTLARNAGLGLAAAFVAVAGWSDPGASAVAWLSDLSPAGAGLVLGGAVGLALLALLAGTVVNLVAQNGRLLDRMDAVERAIAAGATGAPGAPVAATTAAAGIGAAPPPFGLPAGTPAPHFSLPDLDGALVSLDTLRATGAPVLLLFTDPQCGPCNQVMRDVRRWERAFAGRLTIAVLSRGSGELNAAKAEEHGLTNLLIQPNPEVSEAYRMMATPSAVVLRTDGTTAGPAAGGVEAIRALVVSLMEHGTVPAAPAPQVAATPSPIAPDFRLRGLDGRDVALTDLRAARLPVVLIFTDPRCTPCDAMLPDLGGWQRDFGDRVTIALISTGTPEANRAKAEPHGITRVLLQQNMETVEAYGVTQAPAAVVVRPDGTRDGDPAYGEVQIRDLMARVADAPELRPAPAVPDPDLPSFAGPQLRVGEVVPPLELRTVDGRLADLADVRGADTVLLFWSPGCGHCRRMEEDLRAWEAARTAVSPRLVVVSTGSAEATRTHGFRSTVVLDPGVGVGHRFGARGTPAAIRIDADGRIASPVASGATAVLALLRAEPTRAATASPPAPAPQAAVASANGRGGATNLPGR